MRETEPIPITIEYRLTEEGAEILRLHGRAAEIRIPECIAGVPVASIAERAFAVQAEVPETDAEERPALLSFSTEGAEPAEKEQPLKLLFLPDTVRHIGAYAFAGCSALEHLHLPEELSLLPEHALDGCAALKRLSLPAGLEEIGSYAFYNCRTLAGLELPEGVRKIGAYAFYNCRNMEKINIPLAAAGGTMGAGVGAAAGLLVVLFSYSLIRPDIMRRTRRCWQEYEEGRRELAGMVIKTAWPIIAGTAVFSITNLIDMVMVMKILTGSGFSEAQAEVLYGQLSGKYVTLSTLPVAISTAIATAALPSIAASVKRRERGVIHRKMNLTMRTSMIISVPAAIGITVLGPEILRMLFPDASDGGALLTVGGISVIFLALCQTTTGILQGINHIKVPVMGALLGAITKTVLNYFLIAIPELNVLGAVLSTTGCYFVAAVFDVCMLSRITGVRFDFPETRHRVGGYGGGGSRGLPCDFYALSQ